jgi:hypothetical protein
MLVFEIFFYMVILSYSKDFHRLVTAILSLYIGDNYYDLFVVAIYSAGDENYILQFPCAKRLPARETLDERSSSHRGPFED